MRWWNPPSPIPACIRVIIDHPPDHRAQGQGSHLQSASKQHIGVFYYVLGRRRVRTRAYCTIYFSYAVASSLTIAQQSKDYDVPGAGRELNH